MCNVCLVGLVGVVGPVGLVGVVGDGETLKIIMKTRWPGESFWWIFGPSRSLLLIFWCPGVVFRRVWCLGGV